MWAAIIMGVMSGLSAYSSNKLAKSSARMAESQAKANADLEYANLRRRTQYRNEELGQNVWNLARQGQELIGKQSAAMAASGFDVSTGDQRILEDTLQRNLEDISGLNRTAYLQQFEDEIQTENNILQYNFEAYSNRMLAKQYSGWRGAAKVGMSSIGSALGAYQPTGKKGKVTSNTGATNTSWMSAGTAMAKSDYGKLNLNAPMNTSSLKF